MDFEPRSNGRLIVAMVAMAALAALAWFTLVPGKARSLALVLLAFFAFRVLLGRRSR
ncbi:MAG: hypothetical protein ACYCSN_09280 [Acidobacteriaceae bacterium]